MKRKRINLSGLRYLEAMTELLQRIRIEDPSAGLYEAADLQWWWREDDAPYLDRQTFWLDEAGVRVACLIRFDSGHEWNNDFFCLPSAKTLARKEIWPSIFESICTSDKASTITVRDDAFDFRDMLRRAGFTLDSGAMVQTHLRKHYAAATLPSGFQLKSRADSKNLPHHMIARNGPDIAMKLLECSLYRPDLDLAIRTADTVAAYGLFWMDPFTHVGLVEPMRTAEPCQRKGLAKYLLLEGMRRLQDLGAETLKVRYKEDNIAAANLYHSFGFQDQFRKLEYRRNPCQQSQAPDALSRASDA